jgi:hypothetical protein
MQCLARPGESGLLLMVCDCSGSGIHASITRMTFPMRLRAGLSGVPGRQERDTLCDDGSGCGPGGGWGSVYVVCSAAMTIHV